MTRLPGLRRLLWLNVAGIVVFAGMAGYHYLRQRAMPPVAVEALRAPLTAAKGEAEVRAKAETLARLTHHASASAWHGKRAAAWLALMAAFVLLWNATSLWELRDEMKQIDDELTDLHVMMNSLSGGEKVEDEEA